MGIASQSVQSEKTSPKGFRGTSVRVVDSCKGGEASELPGQGLVFAMAFCRHVASWRCWPGAVADMDLSAVCLGAESIALCSLSVTHTSRNHYQQYPLLVSV